MLCTTYDPPNLAFVHSYNHKVVASHFCFDDQATIMKPTAFAISTVGALAFMSFFVIVPERDTTAVKSLEGDYYLRRSDGAIPSSKSVGRVLQKKKSILSTNNEDFDSHYPLFLTPDERARDDYDYDEVLLSFTASSTKDDSNSNILRRLPGRKLAEASPDAIHDDGEDHGNAHDLVVHVTYENIYAILVFLITATAFGIATSKIGMVSAFLHFIIEICSFMFYLVHGLNADPLSLSAHSIRCCATFSYYHFPLSARPSWRNYHRFHTWSTSG